MNTDPNNQYTNTPITQSDSSAPVVLFDLDGTLIDSTEAILESFASTFERLGGGMPDEGAIRRQIGHPLSEMYRNLGIAEERIDAYVRAYKEHYRQVHTQKTVLLPGSAEAVEQAAAFARLGVVTTKTGRYSRELLEHFGLMEHFDVLIGSEDVQRHKPDPEPVLAALERMGASVDRAWMVGDTCMDVEAALAAGVTPMGLSCGYGEVEDLRRCGAEVFPSALDAVAFLAERWEMEGKQGSFKHRRLQ
ncbi:HAD family hydrolase [Nitratifractor sp.]